MPYRVVILPKRLPQSEWRASREEAVEDAVDLGLAWQDKDDWDPDRLWWHPLAEIEEGP